MPAYEELGIAAVLKVTFWEQTGQSLWVVPLYCRHNNESGSGRISICYISEIVRSHYVVRPCLDLMIVSSTSLVALFLQDKRLESV